MDKRKCVLYVAMSLDGYIADINGGVDWLNQVQGDGSDNGFCEFSQTVDTVIMGRKSYEQILTFGNWPYKDMDAYVFSQTLEKACENIKVVNRNAAEFLKDIRKNDGRDIWLLGGAELIDEFIKQNLIDEYIVSIIPTILGGGISLFKDNRPLTQLTLIKKETFGDIVQVTYIRTED
ncbi:dihydrofolate reductase family protein [Clostridium chrysemydis]|uniref:dihydrofolate reductase family protein n=1 Tax=Clostridium chrysemydis TaxID=2665504 RepID=UPI001883E873|nr:dihydrofolate reductase family protein [Clostridium chrysemydis]